MMQQELLSGVLVYPVISISGHCHSYSRTGLSLIPEFPAEGGRCPLSLAAVLEESSLPSPNWLPYYIKEALSLAF